MNWLLLIVVCLGTELARSGPPFMTDDPEPVDHRHWEIISATQLYHSNGSWSGTAPQLEINYGALPDLQLHLQTQNSLNSTDGSPSVMGIGDTELGAKYRFVHQTKVLPDIALYPVVALPTANQSRGLGSAHAQIDLPIWFQKDFGKWTTYGGGGYWINPGSDNQNWSYAGWLVQRQLTDHFSLGTEVYYQSAPVRYGASNTYADIGFTWDLSDEIHILSSIGHTIQGPSGYEGYLALQFTLGEK